MTQVVTDITPLLWEIRRKKNGVIVRRKPNKDLRRWKKLSYMDYDTNQTSI